MNINRRFLILLIALAALYLYGSNILPLLGPDEPRYTQVARQMFDSKDFITPRLGDYPWFEKPVLMYWLMSVCFAIFGVTEFAARLPSAISALLCVILTYRIVREHSDEQGENRSTMKLEDASSSKPNDDVALLCASVLGSSLFLIGFSHAATFDMLLTVCITASLFSFFRFEAFDGGRKDLFAAYAFCGLGILAKGFVAPAVIGLSAAIYWFLEHRFRDIRRLNLIAGILIVSAVAGIWLIPVTAIHGSKFWDDFFLQHHLQRYTSSQFHRAESVFFFIPMLLLGTYPWTGGILCGFPKERSDQERKLIRFCAVWLISSFVFFSLSRSKLPGYILPLAPPFAALCGISLSHAWKHAKKLRIIVCVGIFHLAVAVTLLIGFKKFSAPQLPIVLMATVILIVTALAMLFTLRQKQKAAVIAQLMIPVVMIAVAVHGIYPAMNWNETRTLSRAVNPELKLEHKITVYNIYDFSLVFYTNSRVELDSKGYFYNLENATDLFRYLRNKDYGYVIVGNEELSWMQRANFLRVLKVISGPERSIVVVACKRR